jgi:hypothetical protein
VIEKLVPNATILQDVLPAGYFLHYRDLDKHPDKCPPAASLVIYAGGRNPKNWGPRWALEEWVAS